MSTMLRSRTGHVCHACWRCCVLVVRCRRRLAAEKPAASSIDAKAYAQAVDRAIDFLQNKAQAPDGSYAAYAGPGVTAVVTDRDPAARPHARTIPLVAKSLKYLEGFVQPDGAVSLKDSMYRNYETSLALVCFAEANRDGRYDKLIKNAEKFLKDNQWTEAQGQDKSSPSYGGAGYGKHKRPDLSNTQLPDRRPAGGRRRAGRRGHAEGPDLRLPLPEPRKRAQHAAVRREEPRRRLLLHAGRRRREPGRQDAQRRPAQLRLDDLRRPEEHDLRRRRARRSPRQGRHQVDPAALRSVQQSRHGRLRPLLLLPHCSPRRSTPPA